MLIYRLLADLVLFVHASIVAFVILGLLVILIGLGLRWRWVRNFWFRIFHLLAIAQVVGQAWCGVVCPSTIWENQLRTKAGQSTYPGGFVAYWVGEALFYQAEPWVFTTAYTVFGCLVLATFVFGRPNWPKGFSRKTA